VSASQDGSPPPPVSTLKRTIVMLARGLAGVAAVVFWLCPLRTGTQILLFVASIVLFLICHSVLSNLDDNYIDKHLKDGYWPPKPIDWSTPPPSTLDESDKGTPAAK
jgi:hypothetical protein